MVIKFYEMGPGTLILGGPGPLGVSAQVRSCKIVASESVATTEEKPVLSGERLPAKSRSSIAFTLQVTVIQDISTGGLVDWSYEHWSPTGTEPFVFVPNSEEGRARWGECSPFPIDFGGDVADTSPEASFTWRIDGWPSRGDYEPLTGVLTEDV